MIWQAEYIRIYDYLVDYYNDERHYSSCVPAAVITGQPGIGESLHDTSA